MKSTIPPNSVVVVTANRDVIQVVYTPYVEFQNILGLGVSTTVRCLCWFDIDFRERKKRPTLRTDLIYRGPEALKKEFINGNSLFGASFGNCLKAVKAKANPNILANSDHYTLQLISRLIGFKEIVGLEIEQKLATNLDKLIDVSTLESAEINNGP